MANTNMTAPNTFSGGLLMDFNPTITKSDCLVNALNATLLTFNGNEFSLQQDMGNGRVETAYLPEGYIPVGTCEYGDIIYIVSYNPLEDKSQIGCFPSPERNITSDEVTDIEQDISAADFQELTGNTPTGRIKAMSVKKIVYGNKNLNPGDKYIIYEESSSNDSSLKTNGSTLSDFANTSHTHDEWPKLVKLHVVSIEDSGKIVDLNASVKWYDNDYYLAELSTSASTNKPDIDSYRSLVSSAYSIFQSKVSGKLAILAELETIDGFSCTYDVFTEQVDKEGNALKYKIYFNTAWDTSHNDVNPVGFTFIKSSWPTSKNGGKLLIPKYSKNSGYIEYLPSDNTQDLPYSIKDWNSYKYSEVLKYTRTYKLEEPSSTFDKYINEDSYNTKVTDILNWGYQNGKYTALADLNSIDNLRDVTKVTRVLTDTGEPSDSGTDYHKYSYVYNIGYYEKDGSKINYYTYGIDGSSIKLNPIVLNDDVINNTFHKDIPTIINPNYVINQKIQVNNDDGKSLGMYSTDLSNLIWSYTVAPVMPYGVLEHMAVSGSIDFSKIGTGQIDFTTWKYYVSGNVLTLSWGLDIYPEPNKGVSEVAMDFFDNQGFAAGYHVTGKSSYSGVFTEQILLSTSGANYKLNSIDSTGVQHFHAGVEDSEGTIYLDNNNKPFKSNSGGPYGPYTDDAGTLYPNMLYLVRIVVKYQTKDMLGEYTSDNTTDYKTFYRWCWTNGIFNENYFTTQDFDPLQPTLQLDFSTTFDTRGFGGTNLLDPQFTSIYNGSKLTSDSKLFNTLGANVYHINQDRSDDENGNILLSISPGLTEGYNTFNLNASSSTLKNLKVKIALGKSYITKNKDFIEVQCTDSSASTASCSEYLQPQIATVLESYTNSLDYIDCPWDVSGYAKSTYGINKCRISSDVFGGFTFQYYDPDIYISSTENMPTTPVNPQGSSIYGSKDSYLGYIDSFSLNIAKKEKPKIYKADKKTEALQYLDANGDEQSVDVYTYVESYLSDTLSDEGKGLALCLAGTMYNKIIGAKLVTSSEPSATNLISLLQAADNLGIHSKSGEYYFDYGIAQFTHRASKDAGHSNVNIILLSNPVGSSNFGTWMIPESGWGNNQTEFSVDKNDNTIDSGTTASLYQQYLNSLSSTPLLVGYVLGRGTSDTGKWADFDGIKMTSYRSVFCKSGTETISADDDALWGTEDADPVPVMYYESEWKPSYNTGSFRKASYTTCIRDSQTSKVYILDDWFCGGDIGKLSQRRNNTYFTTKNTPVTATLANMWASLLAQIYVVKDSSTESVIVKDNAQLSPYSEIWSKDIIIEPQIPESISSKDLITLNKQSYAAYLGCIDLNSGLPEEERLKVSKCNTEIEILSNRRTISFQYIIDYNINNLVSVFDMQALPFATVTLGVLDNSEIKKHTVTGSYSSDTLYMWTGTNLTPLGSGGSFVYGKNFKDIDGNPYLYTKTDTYMDTSQFDKLAKILKYKNGKAYWENLSLFFNDAVEHIIRVGTGGSEKTKMRFTTRPLFNLYSPEYDY